MADHLYNIDVHAPLRVLFSINILSHPQRLASGVRLFWAGAKLPVPHNRPKSPDSLMTRGAMCSAEAGVTVSPQPAPPKVKFSYNSPSFSLAEKANLVRCFLGVFFFAMCCNLFRYRLVLGQRLAREILSEASSGTNEVQNGRHTWQYTR